MEVVYRSCAGIDIGKRSLTVCVEQLEAVLEQVPDRLPIAARGLHRHCRDAALIEPVGEREQVTGEGAERACLLDRLASRIAPDQRLRPAQELIERLSTIPRVGGRTAEVILVEIGFDMARFGSARQLASWAGMCPGNHESAGVQRSGKTRRGSPWLRTALVGAARSASRTKTYLGAQYRRFATRRGAKRAFVAVGHSRLPQLLGPEDTRIAPPEHEWSAGVDPQS